MQRLTLLQGAGSTPGAHTSRNAARATGRLSPSTGPTTGPHVLSREPANADERNPIPGGPLRCCVSYSGRLQDSSPSSLPSLSSSSSWARNRSRRRRDGDHGTDGATPHAQIEKVRHELGLDQPLYLAYVNWLFDALRLHLGSSPISGLSVTSQLTQQLAVSLELSFLAIVLTTLVGVPLGVIAAVHANGGWDTAIRVVLLSIFSVPVFLTGILLLLLGAKYLGPLYQAQYVPISTSLRGNLQSIALPTIAIAIPTAALTMQMTRTAMIEALSEPHIQMARAKGASLRNIRYVHALKNALPEILTLQGFRFGVFLGGLVVVENIFNLPGLGRGIVVAINQRDFQLRIPQTLVIAAVFVVAKTLVETLDPVIDKRVIQQ